MNIRQNLIYSFAKWNHRYNKKYFKSKKTFKHNYKFIKLNYKHVSDKEIKSILKSRREKCL